MNTIKPYRLTIPQTAVDDLRERLARTRWPDELPDAGDDYGISTGKVRELAEYWRDGYDWRAHEAAINAHPQFTTDIDGETIHFIHVRSPEPDAAALILTHGWPGSIIEFLKVIGPLSNPRAHGGDPADAFHLVIPSIPGFGPAGPTRQRGWGTGRIAAAWAKLMRRLGYRRYGAHGGDWGSAVSRSLAHLEPEAVTGIHLNYLPHRPIDDHDGLSEEDKNRMAVIRDYLDNIPGYMRMHATRPQTVAYALTDSPVGQLAWIADKVKDWTDPGLPLDPDTLLTDVSLHWFFGTAGSSARIAFESAQPASCAVPIGVAVFAHDIVRPVRSVVEQLNPTIVRWSEFDRGGHFAALEVPELLVSDIRAFFAQLRETAGSHQVSARG